MSDDLSRVDDDLVVTLEYVLRLDDGQEVDRSDDGEPLQFLQGRGQILPGLEVALYGMAVGEEKEVVVEPEDGYGEYDPDGLVTMPRDAFPADVALAEGEQILVRESDEDELIEATVAGLKGDEVVLDFNHPLAGETLYFWVKVAGLRPATAGELDHGHVHEEEE
jgi:FKBP-type peptidyl-prolyl cis-trans isomerase SlyD